MRPDLPLETANAAFMSALQVDAIGIEGVQVLRLDLKIVAAVARAETADPSAILLKVFAALVAEGNDLGARPKVLDELASFGLESAFWAMAERELGYREPGKDPPSLRGLLYRLFATNFCSGVLGVQASLAHFVIGKWVKAANASVFASRWRTDMATPHLRRMEAVRRRPVPALQGLSAVRAELDVPLADRAAVRAGQSLRRHQGPRC